MLMRNLVAGLVASIVSVTAGHAATLSATSHFEGNPSAPEHSLWFSGGSNPIGSAGPKGNHFLFELGGDGFGLFKTSANTATLTGRLANAAGQTYELILNMVEFNGTAGYKNPFGADTSAWTLYDLDQSKTNALNYLGDYIGSDDGALQSFNVSLRGSNSQGPLKAQFGVGANDKDANILGFSTWIDLVDQDERCLVNCTYKGDVNINLAPVPLPASSLLLVAGLGGLAVARRRKTKTA